MKHPLILTTLLLAPLAVLRGWLKAATVAAGLCLAAIPGPVYALVYQPPAGTSMWDTWMFCEGEEAHLFYLRSEAGKRWNSIGHAVSKDLVNWKELPPIPTQGLEGSWDHTLTLTGCTVKKGDTYYLFYGAANRNQQVGLMTSKDLIHWEKFEGNPVSESGGPYYGDGYDWRDLSAFYDAGKKQWHAVICARASEEITAANPAPHQRPDAKHGQPAIGHLVSSDLIKWEQRPPLFTSWRWGNLEVPEAFALGGKHYLLFSHGGALPETSGRKNAGGTFYLMADKFEGPYQVPDEPLLLGWGRDQLDNYVGRVIEYGGELLLYHHTCGGPVKDDPSVAWQPGVGGPVTLGAPKIVQQRADGTLWLKYWPGIDKLERKVLFDGPPPRPEGEGGMAWLPERAEDLSIRIRFKLDGETSRVGTVWRWDGKNGGAAWLQSGEEGFKVVIGEVQATGEAMPTLQQDDAILCGPLGDGEHELRVLVRGHRAEVYLDGRLLFATPTPGSRESGQTGVFASGGAAVQNARVAELSPLRPAVFETAAVPLPATSRTGETGNEWLLRELAAPEIPENLRKDLALHGLFTDGMVLQRDAPVPVWGWGRDGAEVAVSFGEARMATKVSGGRWSVTLPAMPASSAGRELTVTSASQSIVLEDVLVGDVWLCSGQSNMQWEMKIDRAHAPRAADLEAAGNPLVRFYKVDRASSRRPRVDGPPVRDDIYEPWFNAFLDNQWRPCTKEWAQHVSAAAYYFARDLQPRIDCPVGIIVSSRGGTDIACWVPADVIKSEACWSDARQRLTAVESGWPNFVSPLVDQWRAFTRQYPTMRDLWLAQQKAQQNPDQSPIRIPAQPAWPSCFYNGMIHLLAPFAVKGVLWYQGEADVANAAPYADRLVSLIQSWRHLWKRPDLPFIIAQLAPFDYPPPEGRSADLRAAQARVPSMVAGAYTANLIDAGMRKNIHPLQKDVAGRRLALVARNEVYGEKVAAYGPVLRDTKKNGVELVLSFDHSDKGLLAKEIDLDGTVLPGGKLKGFMIRGRDKEWIEASARIEGDRVIVSSPEVSDPFAVRYAWADFPLANLYNREDLPAAPFQREIDGEVNR